MSEISGPRTGPRRATDTSAPADDGSSGRQEEENRTKPEDFRTKQPPTAAERSDFGPNHWEKPAGSVPLGPVKNIFGPRRHLFGPRSLPEAAGKLPGGWGSVPFGQRKDPFGPRSVPSDRGTFPRPPRRRSAAQIRPWRRRSLTTLVEAQQPLSTSLLEGLEIGRVFPKSEPNSFVDQLRDGTARRRRLEPQGAVDLGIEVDGCAPRGFHDLSQCQDVKSLTWLPNSRASLVKEEVVISTPLAPPARAPKNACTSGRPTGSCQRSAWTCTFRTPACREKIMPSIPPSPVLRHGEGQPRWHRIPVRAEAAV